MTGQSNLGCVLYTIACYKQLITVINSHIYLMISPYDKFVLNSSLKHTCIFCVFIGCRSRSLSLSLSHTHTLSLSLSIYIYIYINSCCTSSPVNWSIKYLSVVFLSTVDAANLTSGRRKTVLSIYLNISFTIHDIKLYTCQNKVFSSSPLT